MRPYRVTIRLSRSNRGGAAGDRIRLSPRQLQACAERPRSPGGNLTTGTVPAGRADTSPQPGNGCRCLWQGCDDPEKCAQWIDRVRCFQFRSVCRCADRRSDLAWIRVRRDRRCRFPLANSWRMPLSRTRCATVFRSWALSVLKLLESCRSRGRLGRSLRLPIPVWPCAMKDSAWRSLATISSAGSIAPGACLNQVYAGSYFRRMS